MSARVLGRAVRAAAAGHAARARARASAISSRSRRPTIEAGAKANHLTYIGDASVGADANIGAGTITCNYDGFAKHRTEIGEGASSAPTRALVAPVKIGDGAYVGSGSVITEDVPADALALARGRQVVKEGWASAVAMRPKSRRKKQAGASKRSRDMPK